MGEEEEEEVGNGDVQVMSSRSYWRWSKRDFFPEQSFHSWSSYKHALAHTRSRFVERRTTGSDDAQETVSLRRRSENDMRRCLTWWDLSSFGFGSVIGAGIFVLTGQEAHRPLLPRLRPLRHALRLLLHGVRRRDPRRRDSFAYLSSATSPHSSPRPTSYSSR